MLPPKFTDPCMSEPPFDLKLLPDWLKEESFENPYANHAGEPEGRARGGDRREGPPQRRGGGPGGDRRAKPQRPGAPRRDGGPRGERGDRGDRGPRQERDAPRDTAPAPGPPAEVTVDFIADERCAQAIIQQVHTGNRAFPLFGLARVFLEKPERHSLRITSTNAAAPLYRVGEDGPVSLDRRAPDGLEKLKEKYYSKETIQREPLKGNYTNVARCRLSGTLLGPTNHHSYQSTLRKLYEERFQRRMSFPDYQREIEVVSDPKLVEAWKENSRSGVRYRTLQEPEPLTFESAGEADEHFRKNYLEREMHAAQSFDLSGPASRELPDRRLGAAVRQEWERERRFPVRFGQHLRRLFAEAGLHIFKYHKRVLFVSAIRPVPLKGADKDAFSQGVTEILRVIEQKPRCVRSDLAAAILAGKPEAEQAAGKAALAGDLRWLIQSGHVIEFHDGTLDVPPTPRPEPEPRAAGPKLETGAAAADPGTALEPATGVEEHGSNAREGASVEGERVPGEGEPAFGEGQPAPADAEPETAG